MENAPRRRKKKKEEIDTKAQGDIIKCQNTLQYLKKQFAIYAFLDLKYLHHLQKWQAQYCHIFVSLL